jgi:protein-tyrosine phosphatase
MEYFVPAMSLIPTSTPGKLYVGSVLGTKPANISAHNIMVVSMYLLSYPLDQSVKHYRLTIEDNVQNRPVMRSLVSTVTPLIHRHLMAGENVLIHCQMGMQRAPTMAAHYLMRYQGFTQQGAMDRIIAGRWVAFLHGYETTFF